jgi:hypothetical protein
MNQIATEFLGVELAFSLPDWFPPESAEYGVGTSEYGPGYRNHAIDDLMNLANVSMSLTSQVGNHVKFKFEGYVNLSTKREECLSLVNEILRKWAKPIAAHQYLVQGRGIRHEIGRGYEVLDLSSSPPGDVVWTDTYEDCEVWINQ